MLPKDIKSILMSGQRLSNTKNLSERLQKPPKIWPSTWIGTPVPFTIRYWTPLLPKLLMLIWEESTWKSLRPKETPTSQPSEHRTYFPRHSHKSSSTRFINQPSLQITSHRTSSRRKSSLNSPSPNNCKSSLRHFCNKFSKLSKKNITRRHSKIRNSSSENSTELSMSLKTRNS